MVDGASCAPVTDFVGYANRQIEADGTSNDFYGTCDGTCNDNTAPVSTVDITLSVDVSETSFTSMSMAGTVNGWNNTANFMDDSDGDGVYTITLSMELGNQEYKFSGTEIGPMQSNSTVLRLALCLPANLSTVFLP